MCEKRAAEKKIVLKIWLAAQTIEFVTKADWWIQLRGMDSWIFQKDRG